MQDFITQLVFDFVVAEAEQPLRCLVPVALRRDAVLPHMPLERLSAAQRRARIVARGAKTVAALRVLGTPEQVMIPEPNTWLEIVQAVAGRIERRIAVLEDGRSNAEKLHLWGR